MDKFSKLDFNIVAISNFFRRSPVSVAAAAIYLASQASEDKKSQKGILLLNLILSSNGIDDLLTWLYTFPPKGFPALLYVLYKKNVLPLKDNRNFRFYPSPSLECFLYFYILRWIVFFLRKRSLYQLRLVFIHAFESHKLDSSSC